MKGLYGQGEVYFKTKQYKNKNTLLKLIKDIFTRLPVCVGIFYR